MNLKPRFEPETQVAIGTTDVDIDRELRMASRPRFVYNPSPEWVTVEYGSTVYFFPPDLPNHPLVVHPSERDKNGQPKMVKANGVLPIVDKYGPVFNAKEQVGRKLPTNWTNSMPPRPVPGESATDFLKFVSNNPLHADRGILWLRDDGLDEARKEAAKKIFQKSRRTWAEEEVRARAEFVENFNKQSHNKGQVPPPPTENQVIAQEFLDEIRSEGRVGAEFICTHGCYETSDFAKFQRHMKASHNQSVEPTPDEPVAEKRKPGRPKKAEAAA